MTKLSTGRPPLWTKDFILAFVSNMLLFFSFYMLIPVLPYYLMENLGTTQTMAGIVLSLYTIAALVIRPFSGYLVDTFSRKPLYMLCYAFFCAALAGYIVATTLFVFIALRILHGFSFGISTVSGSTVAVDIMPAQRRGEGIGYYGMAASISMAVGPAVGYWLYRHHSFTVIFVVALFSSVLGFIAITRITPIHKTHHKPTNENALSWDRFILVNALPVVLLLLLIGFGYGILTNYLALYCDRSGFSGQAGWYFMVLAIGIVLARLASAKNINLGKIAQVIYTGSGLMVLGFGLFFFSTNSIVLYTTALLLGAGMGHISPAFQSMVIDLAHHNQRGTANATFFTFWDLGIGAGIALGGFMIEKLNFVWTFGICAILIGLGIVYFRMVSAPYFIKNKLL